MRTTLAIDDDVLLAAKERARREGRTIGEVLSGLARQGLTMSEAGGPAPAEQIRRNGFRVLPHRGSVVSNALIDQLREDEDD